MRNQVNISRIKLMSEVQGDAGASDCLIWRNASKEYKREARELDDQMRELILLSKVTKRMLKEVINVCRRGARQDMYAESASSMRQILQGALIVGLWVKRVGDPALGVRAALVIVAHSTSSEGGAAGMAEAPTGDDGAIVCRENT